MLKKTARRISQLSHIENQLKHATGLSDDNYPIRLHFFIGSQL